jgi:hypothetical protein
MTLKFSTTRVTMLIGTLQSVRHVLRATSGLHCLVSVSALLPHLPLSSTWLADLVCVRFAKYPETEIQGRNRPPCHQTRLLILNWCLCNSRGLKVAAVGHPSYNNYMEPSPNCKVCSNSTACRLWRQKVFVSKMSPLVCVMSHEHKPHSDICFFKITANSRPAR